MVAINSAATFNEFVGLAQRDGMIFFVVVQAAKRIATAWLRTVLMVLLFLPFLCIAQIVPFVFKKHLAAIFPALPYIKDRAALNWLRDAFLLYFFSLKGYKPYCLFQGSLKVLIEELDEHIDSLTFVLENPNVLQNVERSV